MTIMILYQVLFGLATYLVCSIPFGLLLSKYFANTDIRQFGSRNIGATNVTRVLGKKMGFFTLVFDSAKGGIMVYVGYLLFSDYYLEYYEIKAFLSAIGVSAVLGHIFPIYLNFKGGKGVATSIGALLVIDPYMGCVMVVAWLTIFLLLRVSSIAALGSSFYTMFFSYFSMATTAQSLFSLFVFLIFVYTHRENIKRALEKNEFRM